MDADDDLPRVVRVVEESDEALTGPNFIIHFQEKYYLTVAVWEYDRRDAQNNEQEEGCETIAQLFRHGERVEAVEVPRSRVMGGSHTRTKPMDECYSESK